MQRIALPLHALPLLAVLACAAEPLRAETVTIEETVVVEEVGGAERYVPAPAAARASGIAAYGPFRVLDPGRAALVGGTTSATPAEFTVMLRAYPGITTIEMIECPGTEDDRANLKLGRMIRARGIATLVPAGGSVRSGGVELFLAGARRSAAPGAEFAVHSWVDEDGREARDYAPDAPENRAYLDYYREMGLSAAQAAAFYAMTNAVEFAGAKWFDGREMAGWVPLDPPAGA